MLVEKLLQRNDFNHEGTEDTKKCGEVEKEAITVKLRNVDNSIFITSSCFFVIFVIFVPSWFILIALPSYGTRREEKSYGQIETYGGGAWRFLG